ncbi:MAG: DUF3570 domain-containing protein [Cellvibrionaceae bacterium]|nr:DUF3570 domain-containing protein [Cellvibrionaceae bacterium]
MQLINSVDAVATASSLQSDKTRGKSVGMALAAATCALLGGPAAHAEGEPGTWRIDTAVLYYGESDGRVQAIEPVISATRYFGGDKTFNTKLVVDTLTGASPSGATPAGEALTYTKPSGNGAYTIEAGDDTLDPSFRDTRVALSLAWSSPINRDWTYSTALYGSNEYDYQSFGLSGNVSRYFNLKNTQLNFGVSASSDSIDPVGGKPLALSRQAVPGMEGFDAAYAASRGESDDSKTVLDLLIGVTQVINKRTIMQFNYSASSSDGYLTDPYKILSVIDDTAGERYGANALDGDGVPIFIYESRPDSRLKHALYWQTKYMLQNGDVLDGSYRFMTDDWGISSHTFDLKYRWEREKSYWEPHLRYYLQSEADFYQRYLTLSEYTTGLASMENATADYRLGELTATTVGLKYGRRLSDDNEMSLRLEYYLQTNKGDKGFGALAQQELYPDTTALLFTIGYSF